MENNSIDYNIPETNDDDNVIYGRHTPNPYTRKESDPQWTPEQVKSITNPLNTQVGGDHYKKYKIQPLEYSHANDLDMFQGSVVKYITRFRDKNGLEDLKKIKHFVDILIKLEYGE